MDRAILGFLDWARGHQADLVVLRDAEDEMGEVRTMPFDLADGERERMVRDYLAAAGSGCPLGDDGAGVDGLLAECGRRGWWAGIDYMPGESPACEVEVWTGEAARPERPYAAEGDTPAEALGRAMRSALAAAGTTGEGGGDR
jgi:hypothetical protein